MSAPNWQPTSVRQPPAPVSYSSRPIQSGHPNTWNNQPTRPAYQPNTTYQYRSQSNWLGTNTTSQPAQYQAQDEGPAQVSDRNPDPTSAQGLPFGPTGAQSAQSAQSVQSVQRPSFGPTSIQ